MPRPSILLWKLAFGSAACSGQHEPLDGLLADEPVNQRRKNPEPHRDPPHHLIVALDVVEAPGSPAAKKASDLMTEEHDPPEHGHVGRSEHVTDQSAGQRNGPEQ